MKKRFLTLFILCLFCTMLFAGCNNKTKAKDNSANPNYNAENYVSGIHYARIDIADYGSIILELNADAAPATVTNFINLVEEGFYDGLTFHRIINGFMMQGGDPVGDGTGSSTYTVPGEFEAKGYENPISHVRGTISMARLGNDYDSGSCQFFIVHQDSTTLDGGYAAFGKVLYGMDVVDAICTSVAVEDENGTVLTDNQPVISSLVLLTEEEFAKIDALEQSKLAVLPDPTAEISLIPITSAENVEFANTWNIHENGKNYFLFSSEELLSIAIYEIDFTNGDTEYDALAPVSYHSNFGVNEFICVKLDVSKEEMPTLILVAEEHSGAIGKYLIFYDGFEESAYLVPISE